MEGNFRLHFEEVSRRLCQLPAKMQSSPYVEVNKQEGNNSDIDLCQPNGSRDVQLFLASEEEKEREASQGEAVLIPSDEVIRRVQQITAEKQHSPPAESELEATIKKKASSEKEILSRQKQKIRSPRTKFNERQSRELQERYKQKQYISRVERDLLAKSLGLTKKQVKTYFQNRRSESKKRKEIETGIRFKENKDKIPESARQVKPKPKSSRNLDKLPTVSVNSYSNLSSAFSPGLPPNNALTNLWSFFQLSQSLLNPFFVPTLPFSSIMSVQNITNK